MRIFITGGTGFIGEATIQDLIRSGHDVLALARSDESALAVQAIGAVAYRGDLGDAECLMTGAKQCDGVIHLAFDNANLHGWAEKDRQVISTFADALDGSGKALVTTSVVAIVKPGIISTETDLPSSDSIGGFRAGSEEVTRQAAQRGVRSSIVRLPPTVHGKGDRMFLPHLIAIARRTGISAYIEDGSNRWPAVHRFDAARLYRLAAESAVPGECFHAVAEGEIRFKQIAEVIGDQLEIPVRSISKDAAVGQFGWLARFAAMDSPASSDITRSRLDWNPQQQHLLTSLRNHDYFIEAEAGMVNIGH